MKKSIDFFKSKKKHVIALALCLVVSVIIVKVYSRSIAEVAITALDNTKKIGDTVKAIGPQYRALMDAQNMVRRSLEDFNLKKNEYVLASQANKSAIARTLGIALGNAIISEAVFIRKINEILTSAQGLGQLLVSDQAAISVEMEVKTILNAIATNASNVAGEYQVILTKPQ